MSKLTAKQLADLEATLESDARRRDEARVASGECVELTTDVGSVEQARATAEAPSSKFVVTVGGEEDAEDAVAATKADLLSRLRATGDKREVVWPAPLIIVTGVARPHTRYAARLEAERAAGIVRPIPNTPMLKQTTEELTVAPRNDVGQPEPEPESPHTHFQVQVQRPDPDRGDHGRVELGTFTQRGDMVNVYRSDGTFIGSAFAGDSPTTAARRVLLQWYERDGSLGPISYSPVGIV